MLKKLLMVTALSAPFALANVALATNSGSPAKSTKKTTRKSSKKNGKSAKKDVKTAPEGGSTPTP